LGGLLREGIVIVWVSVSGAAGIQRVDVSKLVPWQIETFNQTAGEFNSKGGLSASAGSLVSAVGNSSAAADGLSPSWLTRPGAGNWSHPWATVFPLSQPPRGVYQLNMGIARVRLQTPGLRVSIDAHKVPSTLAR